MAESPISASGHVTEIITRGVPLGYLGTAAVIRVLRRTSFLRYHGAQHTVSRAVDLRCMPHLMRTRRRLVSDFVFKNGSS